MRVGLPSKKVGVWEDTRMLKSSSGDCDSGVGLVGAKHPQIWWNLAQSDCKSCQGPASKK